MKRLSGNLSLRRHWFAIITLAVITVVVLLIWVLFIGLSSNQPGSFFNKGHNAVWIGHEWVGEQKSDAEILKLVTNLKKYQIDTVFVHAGPLKEDGSIDPETYQYAIYFVEKAKKFDPNIHYQAWLGQIRNRINLADETVRHNIAKQSFIMADLVGFDGIHFDIEPVWDNDDDFIKTLKESREAIYGYAAMPDPGDKKISVAMAEFIPGGLIWLSSNLFEFKNFNTEVNYKNVAQYADQIVVMAYDTGIDLPWLYHWLVKEQTIWLSNLVVEKELFIGLPAYDEEKEGFNPRVETLENGLKGVVDGLNNLRSEEDTFAGVAIYPYWEIDESEWKIYEDLFIK